MKPDTYAETADRRPASKDEIRERLKWVREKYRQERDKRLRPDKTEQYLDPLGDLARFELEDPYVDETVAREACSEEFEVVVIGGGFSGLLASVRLIQADISDLRIIECGSDFGGTWYWNRYPGAQCDTDAYCYLPLLEELNYIPKEKYAYQDEIISHARAIGEHFGLYDRTFFQTWVKAARWDEEAKRWIVTTNRGDSIRAHFLISASGAIVRPKFPNIEGLDQFEGNMFHTTRWDYAYTGGGVHGGLTKLGDKNVAVIGTGATGIQCVPKVAEYAKHLYVFQRTPSSVGVRGNKPTDPDWAKTLKPGWQEERRQNFSDIVIGNPVEVDLVNDAWTEMFNKLESAFITTEHDPDAEFDENAAEDQEIADMLQMDSIRARVDEFVKDPSIAEQLKPWYRQFCKRPTFNDEFLPCFNRPNVTLVDTSQSKGVQRLTKDGVVANDTEYKVDCVIFATGFNVSLDFSTRISYDIVGRGGTHLYDHWSKGPRSLHGFTVHGFPNWFYMGVLHNAVSINMTTMFDGQAKHIAYIIKTVRDRGAETVETTAEAEAEWGEEIRRVATAGLEFQVNCTPGFYNGEGDPVTGVSAFSYSLGENPFNELLANWRSGDDLAGMELGT